MSSGDRIGPALTSEGQCRTPSGGVLPGLRHGGGCHGVIDRLAPRLAWWIGIDPDNDLADMAIAATHRQQEAMVFQNCGATDRTINLPIDRRLAINHTIIGGKDLTTGMLGNCLIEQLPGPVAAVIGGNF